LLFVTAFLIDARVCECYFRPARSVEQGENPRSVTERSIVKSSKWITTLAHSMRALRSCSTFWTRKLYHLFVNKSNKAS